MAFSSPESEMRTACGLSASWPSAPSGRAPASRSSEPLPAEAVSTFSAV